jgi:hypothetical protein
MNVFGTPMNLKPRRAICVVKDVMRRLTTFDDIGSLERDMNT